MKKEVFKPKIYQKGQRNLEIKLKSQEELEILREHHPQREGKSKKSLQGENLQADQ